MRSFRIGHEIALFWLPLGLALVPSVVIGTSIHSYKQIPPAHAPLVLIGGIVLFSCGIIGLLEPKSLESWFQSEAPTWRAASRHLLSLVFGCWLSYWGVAAIVTGLS